MNRDSSNATLVDPVAGSSARGSKEQYMGGLSRNQTQIVPLDLKNDLMGIKENQLFKHIPANMSCDEQKIKPIHWLQRLQKEDLSNHSSGSQKMSSVKNLFMLRNQGVLPPKNNGLRSPVFDFDQNNIEEAVSQD